MLLARVRAFLFAIGFGGTRHGCGAQPRLTSMQLKATAARESLLFGVLAGLPSRGRLARAGAPPPAAHEAGVPHLHSRSVSESGSQGSPGRSTAHRRPAAS